MPLANAFEPWQVQHAETEVIIKIHVYEYANVFFISSIIPIHPKEWGCTVVNFNNVIYLQPLEFQDL